ncbi:PTS sugar transporter subunit IIA [Anoxybacillus rupiensis]|uniref:Mannitol-specific phosphotransferase enzyme IIA component n=1 Tax=Anoxybacteroides rupiense TaxID=311460 RepID=A0ABT5W2P7_9BACL|nr:MULTISPECIES: PTS sugar transporter subunit IIA [Anoxybacillus]MBS2770885.1 PTS sugar transporter subunit IIA [Anoxybacillus rupiensis]MDE8563603.1 PTS sugar transporter subunit IIA [Anoxybacillus rupiensis]OQM44654.1 PTS mannitol transporter subunit IIA [Anoxybacillus sp. UARK-01]QHC04389.1 PTS transporter subunit EIIA [Anoxybacillus sp. PDR2]
MTLTILKKENIVLNAEVANKTEAIRLAGTILVEQGYVDEVYIEKMFEREALTSTYMGNFVAIPHGTEEAKQLVKQPGLSIVQVPNGVDFGEGNIVKLLIGIAGKENEHLEILSKIAIVCSEEENVEKMIHATEKEEILQLLNGVN